MLFTVGPETERWPQKVPYSKLNLLSELPSVYPRPDQSRDLDLFLMPPAPGCAREARSKNCLLV